MYLTIQEIATMMGDIIAKKHLKIEKLEDEIGKLRKVVELVTCYFSHEGNIHLKDWPEIEVALSEYEKQFGNAMPKNI